MELEHAIHCILDDVIETVAIQKTVEAHAADATNQQFSYLLREMKFSANSIRLGIDSWLNEMKLLKQKSLELDVKVSCSNSQKLKSIRIFNGFSLARKLLLIWIICSTGMRIYWNDCKTSTKSPKINMKEA